MARALKSAYELSDKHLTPDEISDAVSDFRYFSAHCQQIVNKDRELVPLRLNRMQQQFFDELLPLVDPKTRSNRHISIVWVKPRQGGGTVGLVSFINKLCALVDGMVHLSVLHTLPVQSTISNLYRKKIEPIITGIHPDLMPTIEKKLDEGTLTLRYKDIKGVPRNNFYSLVSAGSNSIRSDTIHVWIADEVAHYNKPEILEDAVAGAMPDHGFSLTVFISTFDDRKSDYFLNKITTARDNPEDFRLIFTPWFMVYPEVSYGVKLDDLELTEYDREVIMPELEKYHIPKDEWGDTIDWYHRKSHNISNMKKEYPTTLDELIEMSSDMRAFTKESIDLQKENIIPGMPGKLLVDPQTKRAEIHPTDKSPLMIFKQPVYGHKYRLVVDPIAAVGSDTDFFAMSMFDLGNNEQVATYRARGLPLEDYVETAVSLAKIYCQAEICPERNIAQAFYELAWAKGYYYWYYVDKRARVNKEPGLRTSSGTKNTMIDQLQIMLSHKSIILHDEMYIKELDTFVRTVKQKYDGTESVSFQAKKGFHDDTTAVLFIYAGSLSEQQRVGSEDPDLTFLGF